MSPTIGLIATAVLITIALLAMNKYASKKYGKIQDMPVGA